MAKIIAHRGARFEQLENTIPALQTALDITINDKKIDGVEFDVELSKDHKLIVIHQETMGPDASETELIHLERNQNRNWIHGKTLEEIRKLSLGKYFPDSQSKVVIPTFQEVMNLNWCDTEIYIELKDSYYWTQRDEHYEDALISSLLKEYTSNTSSFSNVVVITFNEYILQKVALLFPHLQFIWLLWNEWTGRVDEAVRKANELQCYGIGIPEMLVMNDNNWIKKLNDNGLRCYTYPVTPAFNESAFKEWRPELRLNVFRELLKLKVDYIGTDFPREYLSFMTM
jgi:glycerophosphoryl diester phosphodiesterase